MCYSKFQRHPVFCILPPQVLESIAKKGTPEQRAAALKSLSTDNTIRALRAAQPFQPRSADQLRGLAALQPQKRRTIFDSHNATNLPGDIVRLEGAPATADVTVTEAYDGLGATFDFYAQLH